MALQDASDIPDPGTIEEGLASIALGAASVSNGPLFLDKIRAVAVLINAFERAPHRLEPHLQRYVNLICDAYLRIKRAPDVESSSSTPLHSASSVADSVAGLVYVLAKICGHKTIANHFSSEVYLIPQLVSLIDDPSIACFDCECYLMLIWLSVLVLVPFPLASIGSDLPGSLLRIGVAHLSTHGNASKIQVAASSLVASLVSRADCRPQFVSYSNAVLNDWAQYDVNHKLGHLMAMNQILKKPSTPALEDWAHEIHRAVLMADISAAKYDPDARLNSLHALYLIKVSAKICRLFIRSAEYSHVANLINYITDVMKLMASTFDASLRECTAKNLAQIVTRLSSKAVNYSHQLIWYMLGQLRISELSDGKQFIEDIVLTEENLSVPKYHTVLLFMGFLALTKSLDDSFVPIFLSVVHQTLFISQRTFASVQGSQIRDASCFCAWATVRMLTPSQFASLQSTCPFLVPTLFRDLVLVAIFDEDFTIRRCGIAVLQELVGRFGSSFLPIIARCSDDVQIGAFTIDFIQHFDASAVGTLVESHEIIAKLGDLGFPRDFFVPSLLNEINAESTPFDVQKVGSIHIAKTFAASKHLTNKILDLHFPRLPSWTVERVVMELMSFLASGSFNALYALAELQRHKLYISEKASEISALVETFNIKRNLSNLSISGECLMHWLNSGSDKETNDSKPKLWDSLMTISKAKSTPGLRIEFQEYFSKVSLSYSQFSELCRHVEVGNSVLVAAITSQKLDTVTLGRFCDILTNDAVDHDIRASMIVSLTIDFIEEKDLSMFASSLIGLLDDYSITEQGDVGSKLRYASMEFIKDNTDKFVGFSRILTLKLVRIAGESIDKLRFFAYELLCTFLQCPVVKVRSQKYFNDYDLYFSDLFALYKEFADDEEMQEAFWSGIVHSAGSSIGVNKMINSSFRQVLRFFTNSKFADNAFAVMLRELKMAPGQKFSSLKARKRKTMESTLCVFSKLFDAGLQMSSSWSYDALFIRAYNLHLNTSNIARIAVVINIFSLMSISDFVGKELQTKCCKRLIWLTWNHALGPIRVLASEGLFEVAICNCQDEKAFRQLEQTIAQLHEGHRPTPTDRTKVEHVLLNI